MLILFRIFKKLLGSKTLIFTVKIMKDEQNFHNYLLYLGVLQTVFYRKGVTYKCRRIVSVRYRRI